jgi:hypothetical protein
MNWRFMQKLCPECGGMMIENRRYRECGELRCTFKEAIFDHIKQEWLPLTTPDGLKYTVGLSGKTMGED